jgi:hypothetical protein
MEMARNWTPPCEEEIARVRAAAVAGAAEQRSLARENAFPVALGKIVRAEVRGWLFDNSLVVDDSGPASSGERRITIEKMDGPRAGERIVVRRDRVKLMVA